MVNPIEVRLQVAALTLAEELNFTRAAVRLRVTQPALSKQIGELEARVGFPIFIRNQKKVELTEAGEVLIRGFRDSLAALEKAVRTAKSSQDDVHPVISIGHSPYADPETVSTILGMHLPLYPTLRLRIESMFAPDLSHAVLAGELDLALVAESPENPLLTSVVLSTKPLYAAIPSEHQAAIGASVEMSSFGKLGWMLFPRKAHPQIYDRVMEAGRAASVSPVELHHYLTPQEAAQLVAENFGMAILAPGIARLVESPSVAVRPFAAKKLKVTYCLVLRADQSSRLVNEFGRALLKKLMRSENDDPTLRQLTLGI